MNDSVPQQEVPCGSQSKEPQVAAQAQTPVIPNGHTINQSEQQSNPESEPPPGAPNRSPISFIVSGRTIELPYVLPRSNGMVRVYGQPARNPERFRLKWQTGRDAAGEITYDSCLYSTLKETLEEGRKKVDLLNSDLRPRESETWDKALADAAAYQHCQEALKDSGFRVVTACDLVANLAKILGADGVRTYANVYGPRLAKTKDIVVEELVPAFREFEFKEGKGKAVTQNEKRREKCLDTFEADFKGRFIGTILVGEYRTFIETKRPHEDAFNPWLYCLRDLLKFARDEKKALPALTPTECDLIVYRPVDEADKNVFAVKSYARLGAAAPDKETLLAQKLVCRHHVRQEECCKLDSKHFRRDANGFPLFIDLPASISKTGIAREIPIPLEHRAVLKELLPTSGPIFISKDPYGRVRRLAKKLGIPWVRNGQRHSCTSYNVYSGQDIELVAKWDGHTVIVLKASYLVSVPHEEAKLYCSIRFSLQKIKELPRISKTRARKKAKDTSEIPVNKAA